MENFIPQRFEVP